jgi:nitrate/nitrite transporter NarK
LLVHAPEDLTLLSALFFIMGLLLALGYSCYSVYAMGRADKATYPIAYSVINMGGQLGGMVMPLVVGIILDFGSWNAVFASLAGGALLCLLFVLTIVEPLPRGASME